MLGSDGETFEPVRCTEKCATSDDGVCDDGGPGSQFADCQYGSDCTVGRQVSKPVPAHIAHGAEHLRARSLHALPPTHPFSRHENTAWQDCCPRSPSQDDTSNLKPLDRYHGPLDGNLTRWTCSQTSIRLDWASPCLNSESLDLELKLAGAKASKVLVTTWIILILSLMCFFVVAFLVPLVVYSQLVYSGLWPVISGCEALWSLCTGNYLYVPQKRGLMAIHKDVDVESKLDRKSEGEQRESTQKSDNTSWLHWTSTAILRDNMIKQLNESTEGILAQLGVKVKAQEKPTCPCCVASLLTVVAFMVNFMRWEIIFDVFPRGYDTLNVRQGLQVVRLLANMSLMGFLLTHVPSYSTTGLREAYDCALASCQSSGWRFNEVQLECEAAQAVGELQPSFWSDLVDIVQAALSLAVLTLLGEWKEAIEGKNKVGSKLLWKIDCELDQLRDADDLPKGKPRKPLEGKQEAKIGKLMRLNGAEEDPNPIDAVNLAAPGSKLTMAQLFTAAGSIIAIIAGARTYNSQCILNVVLWENTTHRSYTFDDLFTKDESLLELLLMKPEQHWEVSLTTIFRATMSNLTLVTVGIAFKNFITRTSAAYDEVQAMLNIHSVHVGKRKNDVLIILSKAFLAGFAVIKSLLFGLILRVCRWIASKWSNTSNTSNESGKKAQKVSAATELEEVLDAKKKEIGEAAVHNARAIIRVYKISSLAISVVIWWYICVVVVSVWFSPWGLVMAVTLSATVFFTVVRLLSFIAEALKKGCDKYDKRKIDACIYVVQGMIVLRSTLIISQGMMIRSVVDWYQADRVVWESYWTVGDASEKLLQMLTFDLSEMFNFNINITPKVLSFVVLAVEVVAAIGSNIKRTSMVRLCRAGCCQRFFMACAKLAVRAGVLAEKVNSKFEEGQAIVQEVQATVEEVKAAIHDPSAFVDGTLQHAQAITEQAAEATEEDLWA